MAEYLINNGATAPTTAEKRLAYSAWFLESCLKHLFMNRLTLLKIVADGKRSFNNSFRKLMAGLLYSEQMGDGFWEACKHMLYGDQIGGKAAPKGMLGQPWSDAQAKAWAFAELDSYVRATPHKPTYDEWHETLGTLQQ